jgi:hypothetical protein
MADTADPRIALMQKWSQENPELLAQAGLASQASALRNSLGFDLGLAYNEVQKRKLQKTSTHINTKMKKESKHGNHNSNEIIAEQRKLIKMMENTHGSTKSIMKEHKVRKYMKMPYENLKNDLNQEIEIYKKKTHDEISKLNSISCGSLQTKFKQFYSALVKFDSSKTGSEFTNNFDEAYKQFLSIRDTAVNNPDEHIRIKYNLNTVSSKILDEKHQKDYMYGYLVTSTINVVKKTFG